MTSSIVVKYILCIVKVVYENIGSVNVSRKFIRKSSYDFDDIKFESTIEYYM